MPRPGTIAPLDDRFAGGHRRPVPDRRLLLAALLALAVALPAPGAPRAAAGAAGEAGGEIPPATLIRPSGLDGAASVPAYLNRV
ncbi:MAG: hypothetical protein H6Q36_1172, partial [Chloroflexi bacterium]|nr:hypothetical protein [Chloroflexota bacterium]